MPKRTDDVPTRKSEIEVAKSVEACLARQGFSRTGPKKKFIWRKGLVWSIFVSVGVTNGVAHFEVWNYAPIPGLGSYIMYFLNSGKLDDILAEVQESAAGDPAPGGPVDAASQAEALPELPKKTVVGFPKAWIIFWIVANLASACAPMNRLSDSRLGSLVAMVMALAGAVTLGYIMLYYKNPVGLYVVLIANGLALFLNDVRVPSYSVTVTTGLVTGILTYFVTRKQVIYPIGSPPATR